MADEADLSVSHLHALFRSETGMPPHTFLTRRRMSAARHLLATTRMPVKAVAAETGYAHTENFCRVFKKHNHFTPAAYRKMYQKPIPQDSI